MKGYQDKDAARETLRNAEKLNQGLWIQYSEYMALDCEKIAKHCDDLNNDKAYILGLLHKDEI